MNWKIYLDINWDFIEENDSDYINKLVDHYFEINQSASLFKQFNLKEDDRSLLDLESFAENVFDDFEKNKLKFAAVFKYYCDRIGVLEFDGGWGVSYEDNSIYIENTDEDEYSIEKLIDLLNKLMTESMEVSNKDYPFFQVVYENTSCGITLKNEYLFITKLFERDDHKIGYATWMLNLGNISEEKNKINLEKIKTHEHVKKNKVAALMNNVPGELRSQMYDAKMHKMVYEKLRK